MSTDLYKQLVLRLPDSLKTQMREKVHSGKLDDIDVHHKSDTKAPSLFVFTFEGKEYPAKLVNLPCNLETLKTLDNTSYFKSGDVGQMLIVYENEEACAADESKNLKAGPHDFYYSDGITPPTRNIVRRKFEKARPPLGKYKRNEVAKAEDQIQQLMQATAAPEEYPISTVHEEVVKFEPWMLEPNAAQTGRAAGIKLEFTGPTKGSRANVINSSGSSSSSSSTAPVLFGHELLALHPEILLAAHELESKPAVAAGAAAGAGSAAGASGTRIVGSGGVKSVLSGQPRPRMPPAAKPLKATGSLNGVGGTAASAAAGAGNSGMKGTAATATSQAGPRTLQDYSAQSIGAFGSRQPAPAAAAATAVGVNQQGHLAVSQQQQQQQQQPPAAPVAAAGSSNGMDGDDVMMVDDDDEAEELAANLFDFDDET